MLLICFYARHRVPNVGFDLLFPRGDWQVYGALTLPMRIHDRAAGTLCASFDRGGRRL